MWLGDNPRAARAASPRARRDRSRPPAATGSRPSLHGQRRSRGSGVGSSSLLYANNTPEDQAGSYRQPRPTPTAIHRMWSRMRRGVDRRRTLAPKRSPLPARWRSGYAEDCKSLHAGSIPARASIHIAFASKPILRSAARRKRTGSLPNAILSVPALASKQVERVRMRGLITISPLTSHEDHAIRSRKPLN